MTFRDSVGGAAAFRLTLSLMSPRMPGKVLLRPLVSTNADPWLRSGGSKYWNLRARRGRRRGQRSESGPARRGWSVWPAILTGSGACRPAGRAARGPGLPPLGTSCWCTSRSSREASTQHTASMNRKFVISLNHFD